MVDARRKKELEAAINKISLTYQRDVEKMDFSGLTPQEKEFFIEGYVRKILRERTGSVYSWKYNRVCNALKVIGRKLTDEEKLIIANGLVKDFREGSYYQSGDSNAESREKEGLELAERLFEETGKDHHESGIRLIGSAYLEKAEELLSRERISRYLNDKNQHEFLLKDPFKKALKYFERVNDKKGIIEVGVAALNVADYLIVSLDKRGVSSLFLPFVYGIADKSYMLSSSQEDHSKLAVSLFRVHPKVSEFRRDIELPSQERKHRELKERCFRPYEFSKYFDEVEQVRTNTGLNVVSRVNEPRFLEYVVDELEKSNPKEIDLNPLKQRYFEARGEVGFSEFIKQFA